MIANSSDNDSSDQLQACTYTVRFPESNDLRFKTFSYLHGCDLFHKIAVTSRAIRDKLPDSGLLDQIRVITIKTLTTGWSHYFPLKSFKYALKLADTF